MNPYHPGHADGYHGSGQPFIHGPPYPGSGGSDAASGQGHSSSGNATTRQWKRHDALAPLGTSGSRNVDGLGAGGTYGASGSSSGFAAAQGDDGSLTSCSAGSSSWLPPAPAMMQQRLHDQRLQQQQQQQQQQHQHHHHQPRQQHEGEEERELGPEGQQRRPLCWPHAAVQKPQDPLKRTPPMRSPRWLMQYVANGDGGGGGDGYGGGGGGGGGSGGGGGGSGSGGSGGSGGPVAAPAYTVGGKDQRRTSGGSRRGW